MMLLDEEGFFFFSLRLRFLDFIITYYTTAHLLWLWKFEHQIGRALDRKVAIQSLLIGSAK